MTTHGLVCQAIATGPCSCGGGPRAQERTLGFDSALIDGRLWISSR
jgi:hypothetical protein